MTWGVSLLGGKGRAAPRPAPCGGATGVVPSGALPWDSGSRWPYKDDRALEARQDFQGAVCPVLGAWVPGAGVPGIRGNVT